MFIFNSILDTAMHYAHSEWAIETTLEEELEELEKRLAIGALVKEEIYYDFQKCISPQGEKDVLFSFKNLTDFEITVTDYAQIKIKDIFQNQSVGTFHQTTQLIAYQIERYPNLICFESNRKINRKVVESRMILDISETIPQIKIDEENKIYQFARQNILIDRFNIFIDKAASSLILFFDKNNIPKDIIFAIALQYERCIQSDIDQLNMK